MSHFKNIPPIPFLVFVTGLLWSPNLLAAGTVNSGDTSWIIVSTALVFLMTPGLAFFYGGMVRTRHVVSTMYQTFIATGVVGLIWAILGYTLAFSGDIGGVIGNLDAVLLRGISGEAGDGSTIPQNVFALFQGMFAVICPALMTGAFAERVSFKAWLLTMALWSIVVYSPVCHWVWGDGGWMGTHGALDFAGGLVVHTTAGVGALICAITFGRRQNLESEQLPYDTGLVLLGTGLLWFGWFGFNGGSALAADGLAGHAASTTFFAAAAALLGWTLVDWRHQGKPSALGSGIGAVVGLVAITPAAGFVTIGSAILIGFFTGFVCNYIAEFLKQKLNLDDTLDVFACHGVGGIIGALLTGIFATKTVNPGGADGLLYGNAQPLIANAIGVVVVSLYTAVATYLILKLVNAITPIRVSLEEERSGLDASQHGEFINASVSSTAQSDVRKEKTSKD